MASPEILIGRCSRGVEGAGKAIAWVDDVRADSRALAEDADGLIERLRRQRNLARRLGAGFGGSTGFGGSFGGSTTLGGSTGLGCFV